MLGLDKWVFHVAWITTRNMSTYDLLLVTPAELVVNSRPFRLEGLKPWIALDQMVIKADKSGPWPYFYLITTNINGHEVVNVDALVLIVMTRRHLINFAYVSCPCVNFCPRLWSNLYFCHSQNSQKNWAFFTIQIIASWQYSTPFNW